MAYTALRLFSAGDCQIHMCVSQAIFDLIREVVVDDEIQRHKWVIHDEPGQEKAYLDRIGRLLRTDGIDLFWITTINNNHYRCARIVGAAGRTCSIVNLHNLNHWFTRKVPLTNLPALKAFIGRKYLLKVVDGVSVLNQEMSRTLARRYHFTKPAIVIPAVTISKDGRSDGCDDSDYVRFAIPGAIEEKRRDYGLALDAVEAGCRRNSNVSLSLLGAPIGEYGREILRRCEAMRARGMTIRTYDGFVPQKEFQDQIERAHFILAPLRIETSFSGIRETYGETKSSGTMGDMIRYAKPAVVPGALAIDADLSDAVLTYDSDEDFIDIVVNLCANQNARAALAGTSRTIREKFAAERVYQSLEPELRGVIAAAR